MLDCEFFKFTGARTTADIFNVIGLGSDFTTLMLQYVKDFWYLFLIWIFLIIISWYFFSKTKVVSTEAVKGKKRLIRYLKESIIFIAITFISIIGFRGGFQLRPISILSAAEYTSVQNISLVLNTPFTILKTFGKSGVREVNYFDNASLNKVYSHLHNYTKINSGRKNINVVIIILESFSKEYIGVLNKDLDNGTYKGYTPFLDSLIKESLSFRNAFANAKRSIEGVPAIIGGIPALMNDAFITSIYSVNTFNSIASLLKKNNYHSMFFHGGTNGTMGFSGFINSAGFDEYHGRNEYNNEKDFDGKWGIYDEEFLQYSAKIMDNSERPFVACVFTLSSHHPYSVPKGFEHAFPEGPLPILRSIQYTDYSLKQFFAAVKNKQWFDSTLFVITADHTSESIYPEYQSRSGIYRIPIIYYMHNSTLQGMCDTITQLTDILPSILDFLNYDKNFVAYGESVFDTTATHFAVNYQNETYQIIMDDFALIFNGTKSVSLFNIKKDSLMTNNIISDYPDIKSKMEQKVKAIIQTFNHDLIKNEMIIK